MKMLTCSEQTTRSCTKAPWEAGGATEIPQGLCLWKVLNTLVSVPANKDFRALSSIKKLQLKYMIISSQ